jgi:tRNA-2-methylthio-N6-dimethylallyladenosine synthase
VYVLRGAFTRGRERSHRKSIMSEILWTKVLRKLRFGTNVDSYLWYGGGLKKDFENATEMQKQRR